MPQRELPLPTEALQCRQSAEAELREGNPVSAIAWALLAISGQLAGLLHQQRRH